MVEDNITDLEDSTYQLDRPMNVDNPYPFSFSSGLSLISSISLQSIFLTRQVLASPYSGYLLFPDNCCTDLLQFQFFFVVIWFWRIGLNQSTKTNSFFRVCLFWQMTTK